MSSRLAALRVAPYRLPLHEEWASAAGGFSVRSGWLLAIDDEHGWRGHGDCAPLPGQVGEPPAVAAAALAEAQGWLPGMRVGEALAQLDDPSFTRRTPAACCALDAALLDLLAQQAGVGLADWLLADAAARSVGSVAVNASLGALARRSDAELAAAGESALEAGFRVFKLKVGIGDPAAEAARLAAFGAGLPAGCSLRLDANGAWDEGRAARFIDACGELPIDSLEEPLATAGDRDTFAAALRRLQARAAFPLAIDESWPQFAADEGDALRAALPVHRLVVKPPRHGGIRAAFALAERALAAGIDVVVTSSIDSACGVLAAAHLAAAIDARRRAAGLETQAHGLATSSWLAVDTGAAPLVAAGRLHLPARPGIGFVPDYRDGMLKPLASSIPSP
ncbi:enolase C-terminal domain-like protein [Rhodocyclus purpureus]|uniref:enolase C-terminal domain-like protein n=1 Tax=Rhodocyclus purpureus TaxID=1067 RepID=UPI0019119DC0|nr:enolase C-terminal domain-like protein [Rhodocyclus purpureus]MBK5915669.1 hypothetical protein [Rhodocyclus purpureus]